MDSKAPFRRIFFLIFQWHWKPKRWQRRRCDGSLVYEIVDGWPFWGVCILHTCCLVEGAHKVVEI